jgi:hypothetical protein
VTPMTSTDPAPPLSGRALDAEVARDVMEWRNIHMERHGDDYPHYGQPPKCAYDCVNVPPYSTDHNLAHAVEERIAELGLERKYASALQENVLCAGSDWHGFAWNLAHASPEQRCRAALAAVESAREAK